MRKSNDNRAFRVARGAFVAVLMAMMGFPFLMSLSVSLQTMSEIYSAQPVILPRPPQFSNYVAAMQTGNWPRYFLNSLVVTIVTVVVSLVINSLSGFVFARIPFKGRNLLFLVILLGMMILFLFALWIVLRCGIGLWQLRQRCRRDEETLR